MNLKRISTSLAEFSKTEDNLSVNCSLLTQVLTEINIERLDKEDKILLQEAIRHLKILSTSEFWKDIIPRDIEEKEPNFMDIHLIFANLHYYLGDNQKNEKFRERILSCAWLTAKYLQLDALLNSSKVTAKEKGTMKDKLRERGVLQNLQSLLAMPMQRLPKITLFPADWAKEFEKGTAEKKYAESIKRKCVRVVSGVNQTIKLDEYQKSLTTNSGAFSWIEKLFNLVETVQIEDVLDIMVAKSLEHSILEESLESSTDPALEAEDPAVEQFIATMRELDQEFQAQIICTTSTPPVIEIYGNVVEQYVEEFLPPREEDKSLREDKKEKKDSSSASQTSAKYQKPKIVITNPKTCDPSQDPVARQISLSPSRDRSSSTSSIDRGLVASNKIKTQALMPTQKGLTRTSLQQLMDKKITKLTARMTFFGGGVIYKGQKLPTHAAAMAELIRPGLRGAKIPKPIEVRSQVIDQGLKGSLKWSWFRESKTQDFYDNILNHLNIDLDASLAAIQGMVKTAKNLEGVQSLKQVEGIVNSTKGRSEDKLKAILKVTYQAANPSGIWFFCSANEQTKKFHSSVKALLVQQEQFVHKRASHT